MVHRKTPLKLNSEPEAKRNHLKLERQPSSHQRLDTRYNGVGDLKKKMKMERSVRAAIDLPNYMKPTSSWDKKKEQVQVTTLQRSNSIFLKKVRPLVKKCLRGVVLNRPTCSSTLKESKYPKALDLNHGGTEAEGTSVMKVCPYTYCSLNGHRHDDLPPLKCFVTAKRKLIKTQKSMKLKALSSLKIKGLGKNKEENDTWQKGCIEINHDNFFIEIYTSNPQEQIADEIKIQRENEGDQMKGDFAKSVVDDHTDQTSEFSNEEIDAMVSFFEYVECDQHVENNEIEKTQICVPQECEEIRIEFHVVDELIKDSEDMVQSENKASILDFEGKEEIESPFPDNTTECSDVIEDVNQEVEDDDDGISPHEELSAEPSVIHVCAVDGNEEEKLCRVHVLDRTSKAQDLVSLEENNQDKTNFQVPEEMVAEQPEQNDLSNIVKESIKEEENENDVQETCTFTVVHLFDAVQVRKQEEDDHTENQEDSQEFECGYENDDASVAKLTRLRIAGKKITNESDAIREFNPRSPRFLDIEPDPEAETVDLRHQLMDERKNSEEWMIDYALQQAVTKLAPARKKKVALLVEAFETVIPLPTYDKSLQHEASGFLSGRYMQACS